MIEKLLARTIVACLALIGTFALLTPHSALIFVIAVFLAMSVVWARAMRALNSAAFDPVWEWVAVLALSTVPHLVFVLGFQRALTNGIEPSSLTGLADAYERSLLWVYENVNPYLIMPFVLTAIAIAAAVYSNSTFPLRIIRNYRRAISRISLFVVAASSITVFASNSLADWSPDLASRVALQLRLRDRATLADELSVALRQEIRRDPGRFRKMYHAAVSKVEESMPFVPFTDRYILDSMKKEAMRKIVRLGNGAAIAALLQLEIGDRESIEESEKSQPDPSIDDVRSAARDAMLAHTVATQSVDSTVNELRMTVEVEGRGSNVGHARPSPQTSIDESVRSLAGSEKMLDDVKSVSEANRITEMDGSEIVRSILSSQKRAVPNDEVSGQVVELVKDEIGSELSITKQFAMSGFGPSAELLATFCDAQIRPFVDAAASVLVMKVARRLREDPSAATMLERFPEIDQIVRTAASEPQTEAIRELPIAIVRDTDRIREAQTRGRSTPKK